MIMNLTIMVVVFAFLLPEVYLNMNALKLIKI